MRIIGDVHGDYFHYSKVARDKSVQVGDMGFDYEPIKHFPGRFIPGNHDNHSMYDQTGQYAPNCIGRWKREGNILYVGGAFSIDRRARQYMIDWFPNEELNFKEKMECMAESDGVDVIISHDCPDYAMPYVESPQSISLLKSCGFDREWTSDTQKFLGVLPRPKLWIFGHHHKYLKFKIDNTEFVCLNMVGRPNSYVEI